VAAAQARGQYLPPPDPDDPLDEEPVVQKEPAPDKKQKTPPLEKKEKEKDKAPLLSLADLLPQQDSSTLEADLPQAPEMLGDVPPYPVFVSVPPITTTTPGRTVQQTVQLPNGVIGVVNVFVPGTTSVVRPGGTAVLPGSGGFKIADNNSPMPQDRVYFSANIFNDFLAATNAGTSIHNLNVYRESFGMEKTFLSRNGSVGLVLPLNTLTSQSSVPNLNGTHTAIGDLSAYARYALYRDDNRNNWITGGLAVTAPTGPTNFAGISAINVVPHTTILQPFGAYLWNYGRLYVLGFTSLYTPSDTNGGPILLFNDIGVGYFLFRTPLPNRFLTGVAPTVEVHVADPLNDRGPTSAANPIGAFDLVDLGFGLNVLFAGRSRLAAGVVTPVTGPRPFNVEALVQFRMLF
jgi:hypothetical protein